MLNPVPFQKFFDLIVIGEADKKLIEILNTLKARRVSDEKTLSES